VAGRGSGQVQRCSQRIAPHNNHTLKPKGPLNTLPHLDQDWWGCMFRRARASSIMTSAEGGTLFSDMSLRLFHLRSTGVVHHES